MIRRTVLQSPSSYFKEATDERSEQYRVGQLATAPLAALIPAKDGNARKKKRTRERIRRMAVSIHMHGGVLQNLMVVPEEREGKQTGRLEVVAGETRRLGLRVVAATSVRGVQSPAEPG